MTRMMRMMRMMRMILLAMLALAACKKYDTGAKIGERCQQDSDCDVGLDCHTYEGGGRVCLKACGRSALDGSDDPVDTSCPPGWTCQATRSAMIDKDGVDHGAAFGGLNDRPMCLRTK